MLRARTGSAVVAVCSAGHTHTWTTGRAAAEKGCGVLEAAAYKTLSITTGAVLDRLTHRCHILEASGESYRLKDARRRSLGKKTAEPQDTDQVKPSN